MEFIVSKRSEKEHFYDGITRFKMSLWLATLCCLFLWIEPCLWWILIEKRCYIGITDSVQLGTKNARTCHFSVTPSCQ